MILINITYVDLLVFLWICLYKLYTFCEYIVEIEKTYLWKSNPQHVQKPVYKNKEYRYFRTCESIKLKCAVEKHVKKVIK